MKTSFISPAPPCSKFASKEITLDGVTYRLTLFAPETGESSLETRLERLMKGAMEYGE